MRLKLLIFIVLLNFVGVNISAQVDIGTLINETITSGSELETTDIQINTPDQSTGNSTGSVKDVNTLNVRSEPWGSIIGTLKRNDSVSILGESDDGKWVKILFEEREAYAWKAYFNIIAPVSSPEATPVAEIRSGIITTPSLNVRDAVWGAIIGSVRINQTVTIIDESENWYKINYNGGFGWVSGRHVRLTDGTPTNNGGNDIPVVNNLEGEIDGDQYGYNAEVFGPVLEEVTRFADANRDYELAQGHVYRDDYVGVTDCSGFTAQFYLKLARRAGVEPVIPYNSWTPISGNFKDSQYTRQVTTQFPPPDPRDLIRPGDIFIMDRGSASYGHIGVFVGYNTAGEPLIAHSSSTTINSDATYGNIGTTGVRIEPMPRRYQDRYAGMYRFNNMDQILNNLSDS